LEESLKNIFVIPSWYPCKSFPIFGSFIKEQALAIARCRPEYRIIVSLRSDIDAQLSVKNPIKIVNQFIDGTLTHVEEIYLSGNYIELRSPALSLKHKHYVIRAISRLLALNEKNLSYSIKKYGKINLIHAHVGYPAGYIAAQLSEKYGIPYLITEHMGPFPFENMIKKGRLMPKLRIAFENAAGSIAVSRSLADRIASFGIPRPYIVPNLVNENIFKPKFKTSANFVFLTVGGLMKEKGFNDLLDAIRIWSPKTSDIKFIIVGDGPLSSSLKSKSRQLGIEKYIEWKGIVARDKMPEEFNNCNVFVLPSHHETFGIVYAEALASGKPVIATKCGGPEDIVNSSNGLLIEKGNPEALAIALEWMYYHWNSFDPQLIRSDFEARFSESVVTGIIAKIYEKY